MTWHRRPSVKRIALLVARLGKHVQLTELKDQGHEILLNPAVLQAVAPLLH